MLYMQLILSDETRYPKMSEQEMSQLMARCQNFTAEVDKAGVNRESHRPPPGAKKQPQAAPSL